MMNMKYEITKYQNKMRKLGIKIKLRGMENNEIKVKEQLEAIKCSSD